MKILFVCLGNICRSPTAEGVMQAIVDKHGLSAQYQLDSAGTGGWHVGERADSRMRKHASRRGYELTSLSRKIRATADFEEFDLLVTMDDDNYHNVKRLDKDGKYNDKVRKMVDFCQDRPVPEVPDPYYGGDQGFEEVIDILEDACEGLLLFCESGKT